MKIALAQLDMGFENPPFAQKRCMEMMAEAAKQQADCIVFPEMTLTGFTMLPEQFGEQKENSPTVAFFRTEAIRHQLAVVFGVIFLENGVATNHSIVLDQNGNLLADYAKIHPFSYGAEAKHYIGGNKLAFCQLNDVSLSPFVCYDLRFPEIFQAASRHSHILTVIANWPAARAAHWKILLQARAIENQCFIIGVNRSGSDRTLTYSGDSMLVSPTGEILAQLTTPNALAVVEIHPEEAEAYRKEFPLKADRKEALYYSFFQSHLE